ncbi:unnamed protein product [Symbiodinium sp. CCMP2456]|nr:unnamed protein product [Symbiodinium sp. CCMP2456]
MDNVAFLITVSVAYASLIWFLPVPIVFNWKHLFPGPPSHSATDATVQARLQEHKKNWPDWIPVFTRSGEAYFLVWSALRLGFPAAWTKPTYEDLHLWSLLTVLVAFRWSCRPAVERSLWERRLVSTAFSIAFSISQVDMPRQIGHANGVAYVGISLFIGDPWFGLAAYAACCPLKLVLANRSTVFTGGVEIELVKELLWCVTSDVVTCIFVFSILQHIDILLSNVLQTTVDLEHQIRETEKSMQERGHLLSATRRLLSVTCDCCEQLSDSFEVMQPSQNVLALLHIKNPEEDSQIEPGISSLPLRQYICDDDQERFAQFMTASHESQAASSLHLCMRTCSGSPFEAQIFHVKIPETNRPHLIGIKSAVAEMTSIPEHSVLEAQRGPKGRVAAGGPARDRVRSIPRSRRSQGSASSRSSGSAGDQVGGLKVAEMVLTVSPSEAYEVESLQVSFCPGGAKLTSWISTRSACLVEGFLQHHLNCWQHSEQSIETCKKVHFRDAEVPVCFKAGEMSVAEICEAETGEDLPRSMRLLLRSISHRQSTPS